MKIMKTFVLLFADDTGFNLISNEGIVSFIETEGAVCIYRNDIRFLDFIPKKFISIKKDILEKKKIHKTNFNIEKSYDYIKIAYYYEKEFDNINYTFNDYFDYPIKTSLLEFHDAAFSKHTSLYNFLKSWIQTENNIEIFEKNLKIFDLLFSIFQYKKKNKFDIQGILSMNNTVLKKFFEKFDLKKFKSLCNSNCHKLEDFNMLDYIREKRDFRFYLKDNSEVYNKFVFHFCWFSHSSPAIYLFDLRVDREKYPEFLAFIKAIDFYDELVENFERFMITC